MESSWEEKPLGELVSYIARGIAPKYTDTRNGNSIIVLGQRCIRNKTIDYNQARLHDLAAKSCKEEKFVKPLDILINATGVGSAGRVAQVFSQEPHCITDSHVLTLRGNGTIDPIYLGYSVKLKQPQIEGLAEGSTGQTEMNKQRLLSEVVIPYPKSREIQRYISEFGRSIDKKIEINNRLNDYLAEMLDAQYERLIAESSESALLIDIVRILSGGTPKTKISEYWEGGSIPFFAPGDVTNSIYTLVTEKHITELGLNNCNSALYSVDTVFLTARGTVGKVAIAGRPMAMNQSCFAFAGIDVPQTVVFQVIKGAVRSLKAKANGATFAAINTRDLKDEEVPILSAENTAVYDRWAKPLHEMIRSNEEESLRLAALRDALLPKLMSGEIDVSKVDLTQLNNHLAEN